MRSGSCVPVPHPTAFGIDDHALREGGTYGTILVDLERRKPHRSSEGAYIRGRGRLATSAPRPACRHHALWFRSWRRPGFGGAVVGLPRGWPMGWGRVMPCPVAARLPGPDRRWASVGEQGPLHIAGPSVAWQAIAPPSAERGGASGRGAREVWSSMHCISRGQRCRVPKRAWSGRPGRRRVRGPSSGQVRPVLGRPSRRRCWTTARKGHARAAVARGASRSPPVRPPGGRAAIRRWPRRLRLAAGARTSALGASPSGRPRGASRNVERCRSGGPAGEPPRDGGRLSDEIDTGGIDAGWAAGGARKSPWVASRGIGVSDVGSDAALRGRPISSWLLRVGRRVALPRALRLVRFRPAELHAHAPLPQGRSAPPPDRPRDAGRSTFRSHATSSYGPRPSAIQMECLQRDEPFSRRAG